MPRRAHETRRTIGGPSANLRRRGRPFILGTAAAGLVVVACLVAGCAGTKDVECLPAEGLSYTAERDSLGLEDYLALATDQRDHRRRQARFWLGRARGADRAGDRIQGLVNASGLTPDDPDIWLRLAHIWRWVGEDLKTMSCLENAAAAVRAMARSDSDFPDRSERHRQVFALRTAVLRAWLHFDRADITLISLGAGNAALVETLDDCFAGKENGHANG